MLGDGCSRAVATLVGKTASVPVVIPVISVAGVSPSWTNRQGVQPLVRPTRDVNGQSPVHPGADSEEGSASVTVIRELPASPWTLIPAALLLRDSQSPEPASGVLTKLMSVGQLRALQPRAVTSPKGANVASDWILL